MQGKYVPVHEEVGFSKKTSCNI